ncbi:hypothetical protein [Alistipes sp. ZOR0009]|uniref:hypothetical protein n=1 Tax=Alistipes sp. ZOR0009 TaxID=1339253 RepID=UPI0006458284|nr:hypothetical protein [Alistipes sp. ZOR0009]
MDSKLTALLVAVSNIITFLLATYYARKDKKNDLEDKLVKQYQELTDKYVELNQKYIEISDKQTALEAENKRLKGVIYTLKKSRTTKKRRTK